METRCYQTNRNLPNANLNGLANHVDHMCQLLSTNAHTGIGTDLDGGFGTEQTPADLDTIADLNHFQTILQGRGYDDSCVVSHLPRQLSLTTEKCLDLIE